MKAYNHLFVSLEQFEDFLESIELDCNKRVLVRIHSCVHSADAMRDLVKNIKGLLPNGVIIGCSTAKVICEGRIESDTCLISITEPDSVEMKQGLFSCTMPDGEVKSGDWLAEEVSEQLVKGQRGLLLLFYPVSYYKAARFVHQMNSLEPGLKIIGGASYMPEKEYQTDDSGAYVVMDTEVVTDGVAAVLLTSPGLAVYENVICGVENVGRSYEVTKVHANYLDEIEGMDAAEWYEEQLGREELMKDPNLVGIFPLIREDTSQIAYNVVYEPLQTPEEDCPSESRSRISMFTEIREGMQFSLGYFDPGKIVSQLNKVYQDMKNEPIEVLFAYDCLSRMWMLHDCAKWEIGQFYTTNMSGALLSGEISNIDGENIYANSTFVMAGISENSDARLVLRGKDLKDVSALQHNNVQMINYLLKTGNKQLSTQLSEQRDKMNKAMFYNVELGLDNQSKFLFDRDRRKLHKIAVFNLKNERVVRLFMGQTAFFEELKKIYQEIKQNFKELGLQMYIYGESSLLIASEDGIEDEEFIDYMQKIYEYLKSIDYAEFVFSYVCAIVLDKETPFQKAEVALQYGIKNKIPFVLYHEMPEDVLGIKEEMHILQILKDALVHDRICPYFQGIFDNRTGRIGMYEALIRIKDEQGKVYFPNQFLNIAKEYSLYEALSAGMINKVMRMFMDKDIRVSININVQDIYDRDIIKAIFKNLKAARQPENFVFELVESEEVKDYQFIKQFADSIHEHGAKIAIDDFGSGFSNLMHVIQIDADIIKIDGAIIKEVCHDKSSKEFVEIIHDWCNRQGKEVVAEFVENAEIQQVIEGIGIVLSQGYYFAKPLPLEECLQLQNERKV